VLSISRKTHIVIGLLSALTATGAFSGSDMKGLDQRQDVRRRSQEDGRQDVGSRLHASVYERRQVEMPVTAKE
jgi:hypothetical protein